MISHAHQVLSYITKADEDVVNEERQQVMNGNLAAIFLTLSFIADTKR